MQTFFLSTLVFAATVHFMMGAVLALYSRYKVQYLPLTWIMIIFCASFCISIPYVMTTRFPDLGILHPLMLLLLVITSYLQSIYPLGISMPGYLQWGRMLKYAAPAIALILIYLFGMSMGSMPLIIHTFEELTRNFLCNDMLLRITALGLSIYYTVNIFRLPHVYVKNIDLPGYLKGYATAMGFSTIFYVIITLFFNYTLIYIYIYVFCVINMYMFFRTLETMALHLPKPEIKKVEEAPSTEVIEQVERENFNEANLRRFLRVEYYMQTQKEWTNNTFGRDRLCDATGINRHLLLQCLRSQGYNNIHDYINSYRINALKKGISNGSIRNPNECTDVGFGSVKTARSCFERMEGISLDSYFKPTLNEENKKSTANNEIPKE